MSRSRARGNLGRSAVAFCAAILLVAGGASPGFADQLAIDGDGVVPVESANAVVAACTDMPVEFGALVAARRNGNPSPNTNNNVFANNSSVSVTVSGATNGMTVTLADSVIALPATWQADGSQNSLSAENLAAEITLPAQSASGSGTVSFGFAGVNNAGAPVVGTTTLAVTWTTARCITDTTAPALTLPASVTEEATGPSGAAATYAASATDETGPAIPAVSCLPASGAVFPLGTTTVACSATDAAGNTATGSFPVLVRDTTAPVVGAVTDIAFEATGPLTTVTWTDPVATDAVAGAPAVTCAPASGSGFAPGATEVVCTASDGAGNTGSSSFTVTISDTTAPSLVIPEALTVEATGAAGAVAEFEAAALDLVDGALPVTCDPASGSLFALGATTVDCTVADSRGNAASGSFTVSVVDTTAPELTLPAPITAEATGPAGAAVPFTATATDAVDADVTVVCTHASGATFPLGATQVECTATDDSGNAVTAAFSITVVDTTAPELTVPATITAEATGPGGAPVGFTASASDLVDGDVAVECTPASGATFALGSHQVDCTATDAAGNTGRAAFAVVVEDTTAPVLTWVGGPADGGEYVFGSVPAAATCTAVDLVDGAVACSVADYSGAVGSHTLTASATDASGNSATATRSYTVAAWTLGGFFQPVDLRGVWNSVKGGATVPLKFEVFAGATELTSTTAVAGFAVKGVACPGSAVVTDDIELTTTGATTLRYDATAGQFVQNWQTPKKPGACYQVTMTTQDGSSTSALFKLK